VMDSFQESMNEDEADGEKYSSIMDSEVARDSQIEQK